MSAALIALSPYSSDRALRVVVESPKGSTVKLTYDCQLETFCVSRGLPLGVSYPYDFGFIPGTCADDGDPVDALVLHSTATYPGVVLPCRVLGMIEVRQDGDDGVPQTNNRIVALPHWIDRLDELGRAADLPKRVRDELEHFFLSVTRFTTKNARIHGWKGKTAAEAFIRRHVIAKR